MLLPLCLSLTHTPRVVSGASSFFLVLHNGPGTRRRGVSFPTHTHTPRAPVKPLFKGARWLLYLIPAALRVALLAT